MVFSLQNAKCNSTGKDRQGKRQRDVEKDIADSVDGAGFHGVPRSIVVLNVTGEVLDSCCPIAIKPDMVAAIAV
jgi:hypothetical protein